jgi:uncharacterized membrane protein YraQ (UPF0718 family)
MSDSVAAAVGEVPAAARVSRRAVVLGTLGFIAVAVAALTWSKWYPYWEKIPVVADSHTLGTSILNGEGDGPPAPSWRAAIDYAVSYGTAIWPAMVAGLLIASAVDAFLPARRLVALFRGRRGTTQSTVSGGMLSLPSMMCTCCAAPVAVGIRRRGVPIGSALAFWLGNPVLNPAALAFMAIVLPWQFVTVRLVTGVVLVFGVAMAVGRWAGASRMVSDPPVDPEAEGPSGVTSAGRRFLATLGRLSVRLLPEYLVVILVLGGLRGWLFPAGMADWGLLAVILCAVVGMLFMIPTAGEIPIIQGLLAAGVGLGPVGALILTLPAVSLPSLLMVRRVFPVGALVATSVSVIVLGLVGAGLLVLLS